MIRGINNRNSAVSTAKATVSAVPVMLPSASSRRVPPHGGDPGLSTLRNPGSIANPTTTVVLASTITARKGPVVTRSSSVPLPEKRTSALAPTASYDNNDGVDSLASPPSTQAQPATPAAAAAAAAVPAPGCHGNGSVSSASGDIKQDFPAGIDGRPGMYRAAGLYSMTNDELLELLFQRAGLQALQFAPALPHMAASTRYMQVSPDNLAEWVSLLVDLEVQYPATVLAPCPAFLMVPLTHDPPGVPPSSSSIPRLDSPNDAASRPLVARLDTGFRYGGPEYSECCRRFVGHLRDTLLMDEREVFGLLARFQNEEASPPLASLPPASVLLTYPQVPAAEGAGLEETPTSSHHNASGPACARRSQSLSEEEELDLALYHFLRHAPAVLAMTQTELSCALEWLSAEGGLDYLEMCRLLCAAPQLLLAVAARLAEAAAREMRRPTPLGASAADASTVPCPHSTTLQNSGSEYKGLRSDSRDHLEPCDGPPTPTTAQSAVQGEVGDIGDAGWKCERAGRGTICVDDCTQDLKAEIRRVVGLARRQTALEGLQAVQTNTAKVL
ncbi:hypothetical protein VaNZ11_002332 [Volvox africanus]|uniref:Uncharacterized protein n=1 Tax=Volvox africanus TaxID=51714 RepID=A0ABQ5RRN4_9CHLO|nr:hypothetical protein VaNZ11_002332 [Volvox africanus]